MIPTHHLTTDDLGAILREQTQKVANRYVGVVTCGMAGATTATFATGRDSLTGGTPDRRTSFHIGSVTKTFTALALADAVVTGGLTLDTPLADVIKETPTGPDGEQITLGHLASHNSGLPRLPQGLRRQALRNRADPYSDFSRTDLLAALQASRPHTPGKRVRYSNFGAALLGEALSRHYRLPYGHVISERVAGPLALPDTTVAGGREHDARAAVNHSRRKRPVPPWDLGAMPGAGALWSTAEDLQRYVRAHLTPGSSAMPQALELVQQPRATANRGVRIGLGWHLSPLKGTSHTLIWHNGATAGSYCYVGFIPKAQLGVIVLTNTGRSVDPLGVRVLMALARSVDG